MPRKKSGDDETPRRRGAAVAAAEPERSLWLRVLLYSPKDMVAGLIAFAACSAIITNALFLQNGPHPAPMFGSVVATPTALLMSNPLPRPRPAEADAPAFEPKAADSHLFDPKPSEPRPAEQRSAEPKAEPRAVEPRTEVRTEARIETRVEARPEPKSVEPRAVEQRTNDPLANLVKATIQTPPQSANVLRPPASIPTPLTGTRRVAAVQRALTEYGYGQLKPTGSIGPDTKIAIEKFERERRLPVTGQVSERLVRELAAVIGHPID